VIGGNVIAAQPVRPRLAANSDAAPTAAISRAQKDDDDSGRCVPRDSC
jgi:hypothetical protein